MDPRSCAVEIDLQVVSLRRGFFRCSWVWCRRGVRLGQRMLKQVRGSSWEVLLRMTSLPPSVRSRRPLRPNVTASKSRKDTAATKSLKGRPSQIRVRPSTSRQPPFYSRPVIEGLAKEFSGTSCDSEVKETFERCPKRQADSLHSLTLACAAGAAGAAAASADEPGKPREILRAGAGVLVVALGETTYI